MYYEKYIKHKTQYLDLTMSDKYNDYNFTLQLGSGIKSAKNNYDKFLISGKKDNIIQFVNNLNKDNYLKSLIDPENPRFEFKFEKENNNVLKYKDKIFCILAKLLEEPDVEQKNIIDCQSLAPNKFRDRYIEWVIKNYISGNIQLIEDIHKVKNDIKKYILLKDNKAFKREDEKLNNGLHEIKADNPISELSSIINKYDEELKDIYKKKGIISKDIFKEAMELDTDLMTIYAPKNIKQSRYFGCNTKWCTAATRDDMFDYYNQYGQLYIIIPKQKKHSTEKYQLHFETKQYMDEYDEPLGEGYLEDRFKDDREFLIWLTTKEKCIAKINENTEEFEISNISDIACLKGMDDVEGRGIRKLRFNLNVALEKNLLPNNLQEIYFGRGFNQPLMPDVLPNNLQKIFFGHDFNQSIIPGVLPNNLQVIAFGYDFNQTIMQGVLPNNLQHLFFSHNFNQPIAQGVLPNNLEYIYFGDNFNQRLMPGVLPNNLIDIYFDNNFNQPLMPGVLPNNLKGIYFGNNFNQRLMPGVLPNNLKRIVFSHDFNQPIIPGVLPNNLKKIVFGHDFNQPIIPGVLPNNLKYLIFGNDFNQPIDVGALPNSIITLEFGDNFNQELKPGVLPIKLEEIKFGRKFKQRLPQNVLPTTNIIFPD